MNGTKINNKKRSKLCKAAVWFSVMLKRLLFRKSFIALLILIPVLCSAITLAVREDNGIMTIMLFAEDGDDVTSNGAIKYLTDRDGAVNFKIAESEEEAKDAVLYGKADAAWVFPADLDGIIARYAKDLSKSTPHATVYLTGDGTLFRLVREKLSEALFPYLSHEIYRLYSKEYVPAASYDESTAEDYFTEASFDKPIVEYEYLNDSAIDPTVDYLLSPVRGFAALASLLCTLAASMYSMKDEKGGFLSRIPAGKRILTVFASNFGAALVSSAVMLVSLCVTGIFTNAYLEITSAITFALASASFCTFLCRVFSSPYALGAALPPIMALSAALCPVFFYFKLPVRADMLFPPTYYLRGVNDPEYSAFALIYCAVFVILAFALNRIREGRE
ncbi:MAG: ABC transporter permease [Clostridia bacterium]|nr:ABC transporter permease [Clostridia bacterium]